MFMPVTNDIFFSFYCFLHISCLIILKYSFRQSLESMNLIAYTESFSLTRFVSMISPCFFISWLNAWVICCQEANYPKSLNLALGAGLLNSTCEDMVWLIGVLNFLKNTIFLASLDLVFFYSAICLIFSLYFLISFILPIIVDFPSNHVRAWGKLGKGSWVLWFASSIRCLITKG